MMGLMLDRHGWLKPHGQVQCCPSPNYDKRPAGVDPTLLVLHNISLPPGQFGKKHIVDFFLNRLNCNQRPWFENIRNLKVSAHFLIDREGTIIQFVSTRHRAWHAGVSSFNGRQKCNDFSIGVELEGTDTQPYTDACIQMAPLCARRAMAFTPIAPALKQLNQPFSSNAFSRFTKPAASFK